MGLKLVVMVATVAILIVTGIVILLLMLVAMNGFSEKDATWGLGAYVVLMILISAACSAGAGIVAKRLINKGMTKLMAVLIPVPLFSIVGTGCEIVAAFIGVAIAEVVRINF